MIAQSQGGFSRVVAMLSIACAVGSSACARDCLVAVGDVRLAGTPRAAFRDTYAHSALVRETGYDTRILDWCDETITIISKSRKMWYRGSLDEYQADMLALRIRENEMGKRILNEVKGIIPAETVQRLEEMAVDDLCEFPSALIVVEFPTTERWGGADLVGYSVSLPDGRLLGKLWVCKTRRMGDFLEMERFAVFFEDYWLASEPFLSHSAAGFYLLAHADVLKLFNDGFPVKVDVFGPTGEKDEYTWSKIEKETCEAGILDPPAGFRRADLDQVMALPELSGIGAAPLKR